MAAHALSRKRKLVALLIAGCADLVQGVLFPFFVEGGLAPVEWVVDIAVAIGLLLVVGFKARFIGAFVVELVPGLALFPTWTTLVLTLPVDDVAAPSPSGAGGGRVIDIRPVREDES